MKLFRTAAICVSVTFGAALASTATAAASTTVPFQLDPAPFGNPNGSFDLPAVGCAAVVGEVPGTVRITGREDGGWGCLISSQVYWLNVSTGSSGNAVTGPGLGGLPPEATLVTGAGQVIVTIVASNQVITPGAAVVSVP